MERRKQNDADRSKGPRGHVKFYREAVRALAGVAGVLSLTALFLVAPDDAAGSEVRAHTSVCRCFAGGCLDSQTLDGVDEVLNLDSHEGEVAVEGHAKSSVGPGFIKVVTEINLVSGSGCMSSEASGYFDVDDLIVSPTEGGPSSGSIDATVLLTFDGMLTENSEVVAGEPWYNFLYNKVEFNAPGAWGRIDPVDGHLGVFSDVPRGESPVFIHKTLSLPVSVAINESFHFWAKIDVSSMTWVDHAACNNYAAADFGNTLSFPDSGPVLILPEGYTVNSKSANVVNNRWLGEKRLVDLDVNPGPCPRTFDPAVDSTIVAAIAGSADLDVRLIGLSTIRLEGVAPTAAYYVDATAPRTAPLVPGEGCACEERGEDGVEDLILIYDADLIYAALDKKDSFDNDGNAFPLTLTGHLSQDNGGTEIEGVDCVEMSMLEMCPHAEITELTRSAVGMSFANRCLNTELNAYLDFVLLVDDVPVSRGSVDQSLSEPIIFHAPLPPNVRLTSRVYLVLKGEIEIIETGNVVPIDDVIRIDLARLLMAPNPS